MSVQHRGRKKGMKRGAGGGGGAKCKSCEAHEN